MITSFRTVSCPRRSVETRKTARARKLGLLGQLSDTIDLHVANVTSFENREVAEKVLAEFHSVTAADGVKLNLRFADTKAQKQLKAQSNERRNYRKDEYAYSVEHGTTPSPSLHRLQQTAQHFSPASQASYPSPAGVNPIFTPATSVSPP